MTDHAVVIAAAQRSLIESVGPFVDADTLGTLLARVAEIPYADDVPHYVEAVAEVARETLQPVIDRLRAERAHADVTAALARGLEALARLQTSPTIH